MKCSMKLILLAALVTSVYGAKILGIFPNYGYSQFILGDKLMTVLAARGHEVTVISAYPSKTPIKNLRTVSTAGLANMFKDDNLFSTEADGALQNILAVADLGLLTTEYTLENAEVQELLKSNTTFDLVLCEQFFNEAHMGFAHHFKTPLILFSSIGPSEWTMDLASNPTPYAYVPSAFSDYSTYMTFAQRLRNAFIYTFYRFYQYSFTFPEQNKLLQKFFPGAPNLNELMYSADLILFNSHISTHVPAPAVPSMIEIGGFHVDPQPLPRDLQEFLDSAKEGVVYFSMGSVLKGKDFPLEKREALIRSFSRLKEKVLWKWESDFLPDKPGNVKVAKWLPQQDILGHPNVKVFMSHCGLLSTIESVYHGVPVICIPIFGDQHMNSAVAESFRSAITLRFSAITEEKVTHVLKEILNNPKYSERAKLRSKFMRDQPMKPIDKAMYWIEYVIRHQGAGHLRVQGLNLKWYQYYLVDIVAFVLFTIFTCAFVIIVTIKKTCLNNLSTVKSKKKEQ